MLFDLLKADSGRKTVALNTLYQIAGKFLSVASTLPISFVLANQFGADGYGDFTKVMSYLTFFFVLGDFGFNAVYLQLAHESTRRRALWFNLLGLRLLVSIVLMLFVAGSLLFLPSDASHGYTPFVRFGILLYLPALLFQNLITSANAVFQKDLRYDRATIAIFAGTIMALVFLAPMVSTTSVSMGVTWAILGILAGTIVTGLVSLWFARSLTGGFAFRFHFPLLTQIFRPSIPLGITILFNVIYFRIDTFILTVTRPTADVGIYGLAFKVFEIALVLPSFFINAVYPLLVQSRSLVKPVGTFGYIVRQSGIFLLASSVLVVIGLWVCAPLLSLIKADFIASIWPLRVLSLGIPFFFLTALTMWTIIAMKKQVWLIIIYGLAMVVNIVLNLLFIPQGGYVAAAWIRGASEGLILVLSLVFLLGYRIKGAKSSFDQKGNL